MLLYDAYKIAGKILVDNVCFAASQNISYVTAFLFSTENWKRDQGEIDSVFKAFSEILFEYTPTFLEHDVRVHAIGDMCALPLSVKDAINHARNETYHCSATHFVLAFNYGGRWDIVNAVQKVLKEDQGVTDNLTEKTFASYLSTAKFGDPDLLIRTGGQQRVSNFLMWQLAYSELYFSQLMWPDFDTQAFQQALDDYHLRERRKGA